MTKQQLKRRLVGATVLASLAVIFVPMMLDSRPAEELVGATIPERDVGPFNETLGASDTAPIERGDATAVAALDPNRLPPTAAGVPAAGGGEADRPGAASATLRSWVVQVGSFSQQDNAEGMAQQLRAAGFDTVIEKAELDGQTLYRVQVGPEAAEARAELLRQRIHKTLKLDGSVREHPAS